MKNGMSSIFCCVAGEIFVRWKYPNFYKAHWETEKKIGLYAIHKGLRPINTLKEIQDMEDVCECGATMPDDPTLQYLLGVLQKGWEKRPQNRPDCRQLKSLLLAI